MGKNRELDISDVLMGAFSFLFFHLVPGFPWVVAPEFDTFQKENGVKSWEIRARSVTYDKPKQLKCTSTLLPAKIPCGSIQ